VAARRSGWQAGRSRIHRTGSCDRRARHAQAAPKSRPARAGSCAVARPWPEPQSRFSLIQLNDKLVIKQRRRCFASRSSSGKISGTLTYDFWDSHRIQADTPSVHTNDAHSTRRSAKIEALKVRMQLSAPCRFGDGISENESQSPNIRTRARRRQTQSGRSARDYLKS
jgi:hypothetical protein